MINFYTDDLFFPKLPEMVACKALKLLNGLQIQVFNSVGDSGWFSHRSPMEQTAVIIEPNQNFGERAVYYIFGRYRYAPNTPNAFTYNGHLNLIIEKDEHSDANRLTGPNLVLNYEIEAKGTKEEVMRQVDWR